MLTEINRKLFTVAEYHRMVGAGILQERDRVELIDGEIIEMTPIGLRHWISVNRANVLFTEALGRRVLVSIQSSAPLSDWSEPEPDVTVFKPRQDFYAGKRREPDDILLIVEVSDSSLTYDRQVKVPLYATAGIPEVWIEDLINDVLLVYRDLTGDTYATVLTLGRADSISPLAFPDIAFKIEDLFGGAVTAE